MIDRSRTSHLHRTQVGGGSLTGNVPRELDTNVDKPKAFFVGKPQGHRAGPQAAKERQRTVRSRHQASALSRMLGVTVVAFSRATGKPQKAESQGSNEHN